MSNQILITLSAIAAFPSCVEAMGEGWDNLVELTEGDMDKEFPVSSILTSNGFNDTLSILNFLPDYKSLWIKFGNWCALQNIEKIKNYCSDEDYQVLIAYLNGDDSLVDKAYEVVKTTEDSVRVSAKSLEVGSSKSLKLEIELAKSSAHSARIAVELKFRSSYGLLRSVALSACNSLRSENAAVCPSTRINQENKLKEILDSGEFK